MIAGGLLWIVLVRRRHGSALLPRDEPYPGVALPAAA